MKKFKGIPIPKSWSEITLKQFSDYNKVILDFIDKNEKLEKEGSDKNLNKIAVNEIKMNFKVIELLSGLKSSDVYAIDIGLAKAYIKELKFLTKEYEPKPIKSFVFNDVNYNLPQKLKINTKYGQYIEALQAEMVDRYTDKNSLIYLAHQLAHMVDNGRDWSGEERDKLAKKFEDLPASIGLDFAFFLSKKCQIYSLAYLNQVVEEEVKKLPFIKRILKRLGGLKHYMSLQNVKYLINLIKLRLIVFYTQTQDRFSVIYRTLQRKATMNMK